MVSAPSAASAASLVGVAFEAAIGLGLVAWVGRVALSLSPPGRPGGHAPHQLVTTWATSHLVGVIVLAAESALFERLGVDTRTSQVVVWMCAPWLLVLLARRALTPAAMVPRHEAQAERPGRTAAIALFVVGIATLTPWMRAFVRRTPAVALDGLNGLERCVSWWTGDPLPAAALYSASFVALIVLLGYGLRAARRSPLGRRVVLAVFVLTPVVQGLALAITPAVLVALCIGAGAAFAIPWLRRADRRAATLSALSFSGAGLFDPRAALLGLVALASVGIVSASASRRRWINLSLGTWVPLALLGGAHHALLDAFVDLTTFRARLGSLVRAAAAFDTWELRWFALLPVLIVAVRWVRRSSPPTDDAQTPGPQRPIETTARELAALLATLTLGLLAQATSSTLDRDAALLPIAAVGALCAGLTLIRAERPGAAASRTPSR